ncbi:MAG: type II toxin-antitoxin system VapC family toxin [Caulobacteraceae bacterium]
MIHLDTHVIIWLSSGRRDRLSARAKALIGRDQCQISPMVMLELETLFERGKIDRDASIPVNYLVDGIGLTISDSPLLTIVDRARSFAWTRDPFDRLIVANAMADHVRLVTADRLILEKFADAVW